MSDLENPLRFSLRSATIKVGEYLDHDGVPDDTRRRVTEMEIRPSQGNVYVHWEEVDHE